MARGGRKGESTGSPPAGFGSKEPSKVMHPVGRPGFPSLFRVELLRGRLAARKSIDFRRLQCLAVCRRSGQLPRQRRAASAGGENSLCAAHALSTRVCGAHLPSALCRHPAIFRDGDIFSLQAPPQDDARALGRGRRGDIVKRRPADDNDDGVDEGKERGRGRTKRCQSAVPATTVESTLPRQGAAKSSASEPPTNKRKRNASRAATGRVKKGGAGANLPLRLHKKVTEEEVIKSHEKRVTGTFIDWTDEQFDAVATVVTLAELNSTKMLGAPGFINSRVVQINSLPCFAGTAAVTKRLISMPSRTKPRGSPTPGPRRPSCSSTSQVSHRAQITSSRRLTEGTLSRAASRPTLERAHQRVGTRRQTNESPGLKTSLFSGSCALLEHCYP